MLSWTKFCKKNGGDLSTILFTNSIFKVKHDKDFVIKSFANKKECIEFYKDKEFNYYRWSCFILEDDYDELDCNFNFVYSIINKTEENFLIVRVGLMIKVKLWNEKKEKIFISPPGALLIMTEKEFFNNDDEWNK